ncbi:GxxExxY protein [Ancylomarina euxinus]|uniref:GxxExxY protein n=1 Tax=Ancylomarina euxinus TaxID=2283627 RepID=A0A425XY30_9BACT|nr:GxxExxY protein [Ancylomarina euxinus]
MSGLNSAGVILDKKYYADFLCYNEIIVELKALKSLDDNHMAQIMNCMKATNKKVGLLVNFGSHSLEYNRVIL